MFIYISIEYATERGRGDRDSINAGAGEERMHKHDDDKRRIVDKAIAKILFNTLALSKRI